MSDTTKLLDDYWDEAEFARQIGKSPRTAKRLRDAGIGPPIVWLIDKPLYPIDDARRWLRSQTEPRVRGRSRRRMDRPTLGALQEATAQYTTHRIFAKGQQHDQGTDRARRSSEGCDDAKS